jgi:TrmH family RNA methyltransferase
MDMITSLSNPVVKQVRALQKKKARIESGRFLVEGIHHVGEVIEAGWDVETILQAPELLTSSFAHDLLHKTFHLNIKMLTVSRMVIESLAGKDNPQGILAVVRGKTTQPADLAHVSRAIALVSPQDPGNVGSILRTMDAVGIDAMFLLDGGVDMYHPTLVRASMGSLFWKPLVQTSFDMFLNWSRGGKFQLIGTSARGDVEYHTLVPRIPWVLVLGNEQKGLTKEQMAACDVTVALPMQGRVSSLNLSVAAGVLLYQYARGSSPRRL